MFAQNINLIDSKKANFFEAMHCFSYTRYKCYLIGSKSCFVVALKITSPKAF